MGEHLVGDHRAVSLEGGVDDGPNLLGHPLTPSLLLGIGHLVGKSDLKERTRLDRCCHERAELGDHLLHRDPRGSSPVGHALAVAIHQLVELPTHLRRFLNKCPCVGVLIGPELGDPLDDVHLEPEHRIDQVLVLPGLHRSDVSVGLRHEDAPGDPVFLREGIRVERRRLVPHGCEVGQRRLLMLGGEILDLGVVPVVTEDRRPRRGFLHRPIPESFRQCFQLLVQSASSKNRRTVGDPQSGLSVEGSP